MPVSQPKVSVVMLMSPGREAMQCRALRAIKEQTYKNIELVAFDTSHLRGKTIGYMRNVANAAAAGDLIAHFDDDDVSHMRRIEEQVSLLMASGKSLVGFRELLFWDTRHPGAIIESGMCAHGEAWVYRNHQANWAAGASLLYRRDLWQQQPFDDAPHEDQRWWLTPLVSRNCLGVSGLATAFGRGRLDGLPEEPRMVCGIHGSNSEAYERAVMLHNPDVWLRTPEFDLHCKEKMRL